MKTNLLTPLLWLSLAALPAGLAAQDNPAPAATADSGLRFNFRGAPLETVLNYMSDAAGFIIVL